MTGTCSGSRWIKAAEIACVGYAKCPKQSCCKHGEPAGQFLRSFYSATEERPLLLGNKTFNIESPPKVTKDARTVFTSERDYVTTLGFAVVRSDDIAKQLAVITTRMILMPDPNSNSNRFWGMFYKSELLETARGLNFRPGDRVDASFIIEGKQAVRTLVETYVDHLPGSAVNQFCFILDRKQDEVTKPTVCQKMNRRCHVLVNLLKEC